MEGFIRPKMTVLDEHAVIPDVNLISPPPNQFTHRLTRDQPYYYDTPKPSKEPDGQLAAGTKVVLLVYDGGSFSRVVDGRGLYVVTEFAALEKLP